MFYMIYCSYLWKSFNEILKLYFHWKLHVILATGWPERENVNINRLQKVQDMYKQQVLLEKQQILDKDKKKQRKYLSYTASSFIFLSRQI